MSVCDGPSGTDTLHLRRRGGTLSACRMQTFVAGLFNANWKLDRILEYLGDDDEEEEDEADPS